MNPREPKYPGQRLDVKFRRRYREPSWRGDLRIFADGTTYRKMDNGEYRRVRRAA